MAREIKFRFRNKNNGKFVELSLTDVILQDRRLGDNIDWDNPMQYIGLHDKNGKEIWEGDLLKTPGGQILPVCITDLIWGDSKFHTIEIENCEIIGTIYDEK